MNTQKVITNSYLIVLNVEHCLLDKELAPKA